jgi:hypothetical protein
MSSNEVVSPVSPQLRRAVKKSFTAMEASGFMREEIMGEQLPLLASSIAVRAELPVDTPQQIRATNHEISNAISAYLLDAIHPY